MLTAVRTRKAAGFSTCRVVLYRCMRSKADCTRSSVSAYPPDLRDTRRITSAQKARSKGISVIIVSPLGIIASALAPHQKLFSECSVGGRGARGGARGGRPGGGAERPRGGGGAC